MPKLVVGDVSPATSDIPPHPSTSSSGWNGQPLAAAGQIRRMTTDTRGTAAGWRWRSTRPRHGLRLEVCRTPRWEGTMPKARRPRALPSTVCGRRNRERHHDGALDEVL